MAPVDLYKLKRISMRLPSHRIPSTPLQKALRISRGLLKSPAALARANALGVPGMEAHRRITGYGARLLAQAPSPLPFSVKIYLMLFPMDSTRYFEFDYALRSLSGDQPQSYLDVSSPRLLPCMLMDDWENTRGFILNPDMQDLQQTQNLFQAVGVRNKCEFLGKTIENSNLAPGSFDVITSISVVEHIRDDKEAIRVIWDLLKPGGKLVITVPCAAQASYQTSNVNHYGVGEADEEKEYFVEYLYDMALLKERIFSVAGLPQSMEIYGEQSAGFLQAHLISRETDLNYPFWREPLTMAEQFRRYDAISDLPGEGVVGMTFVKNV